MLNNSGNILINWLIMSLAILAGAYLLSGVAVSGFLVALLVAVVLGILNAVLKPILIFLTLPINLLTLGLFTFVINGLLLLLAAFIIPGFTIDGFWWAVLFAVILAGILYLVDLLFSYSRVSRGR